MAVSILKEPPITTREALIPYAMSGLNMLAPTLAAREILDARVLIMATAMIIVGLPVSIYFRQRQYNRIALNLIIMLPLLVVTWVLVRNQPGLQIDWTNPWSSVLLHDSSLDMMGGLLHIFVLLAAGRAFLLVTSKDLLQTPLPSYSIFLLAVITDRPLERDPFVLGGLLILCASSLYLFSQEQSQRWFSIHTPLRFQRKLTLWTLLFSLVILPVIVVFGWSLQPFNMFNLALRSHYRRSTSFRLPFFGSQQYAFSFGNNVEMTGSNWPRGKQVMMFVDVEGKAQNLLWRAGTYWYYDWVKKQWQNDDLHARHIESADESMPEKPAWSVYKSSPGALRIAVDSTGSYSDPGLVEAINEGAVNPNGADALVTQHYTLQAETVGFRQPIYGLFQMLNATATHKSFSRVLVARDCSMSFLTPDATLKTYDVTSINKPLPTLLHLKVAVPLPERSKYLQMPGEGNSYIPGQQDSAYTLQVRRKALAILAEDNLTLSSSPFEIVHRLELYLGKHYQYTLKPAPPKNGGDPILDFIFNQQQGYCNYFSGAMVMLCRGIGFPARFVVGFATGDMVEDKSTGMMTRYRVTSDEAHSWVEVYLPYYGWYTIDPTAGSKPVPTLWGEVWDNVSYFFANVKSAVSSFTTAFRMEPRVRGYCYLAFAVLLVILAGVIYWRRERPPTLPRCELTDQQARAMVLASYQRMHRWLRRWGVMKPHGATALEFERMFREISPAMGEVVGALTAFYLRALYGDAALHDADAREVVELLHQLWELAASERKHFHVPDAAA